MTRVESCLRLGIALRLVLGSQIALDFSTAYSWRLPGLHHSDLEYRHLVAYFSVTLL